MQAYLLLLLNPYSPVVAGGHGFLCIGSIAIEPALTACVVSQAALTSGIEMQPALESCVTNQAALTTDINNQAALTANVRISQCH